MTLLFIIGARDTRHNTLRDEPGAKVAVAVEGKLWLRRREEARQR